MVDDASYPSRLVISALFDPPPLRSTLARDNVIIAPLEDCPLRFVRSSLRTDICLRIIDICGLGPTIN